MSYLKRDGHRKEILTNIVDLTNNIRSIKSIRNLKLNKTGIEEFDELASAIEDLSMRTIESEAKMGRIINSLDMPIAAFEYDCATNTVFTSRDITSFLQFSKNEIKTITDFENLFTSLEKYRIDDGFKYGYIDIIGNKRWLEIKFKEGANLQSRAGIFLDITKEYIEKENLLYERNVDSLTNIYNRRAFIENISVLFNNPEQIKKGVFLMLDLDNLKFINDNYGHDYGDQYIKTTADILSSVCSNHEHFIYGRRSGDEFYVFLYGYDNLVDIDIEVGRLKEAFANSSFFTPEKTKVCIRVSAGISIYPDDADDYNKLMKFADFAMYDAKNSYKGEFKYFDHDAYEQNVWLLQNKEELDNLINNELIDFYFQPIVDTKDGSIFGYEALMRPLISAFKGPNEIIKVANLQRKLDKIEKLTFLKSIEKYEKNINSFKGRKLFINSIASQKISDEDIEFVEKKYQPYLSDIVVEITQNESDARILTEEKNILMNRWYGGIALDNFGRYNKSETSILEYKAQYLKIDISLVRNINQSNDSRQIVKSVVEYSMANGIKTIAEGVETLEELETLINIGCDYVQGYVLGKPNILPEGISENSLKLINKLNSH